ncbi:tyrosine-type recombinase/integrase [Plesiocystis pacifica]|nr:site-specific integrase [Plesiocystis pacifica]
MVHIEHTWPDGRKLTIRKVSPVQTKRGAERYERELRKQLFTGQWEEGDKQQTPTLQGFVEEFLAYQRTINKPAVIRRKEGILRLHLLPAFGRHRLDKIDERMIDQYKVDRLATLTRTGSPFQPQTVNQHLKVLGRIFTVAKKWKLVREVPEIVLLKQRKSDFDFLDFDETEAFLTGTAEHLPDWHTYMVVAVRTGLRVGEMIALRWREDIDLQRGRISVNQSWSVENGFTSTKSDKRRELPLTWDARDALEAQRVRVQGKLVFPREGAPTHSAGTVQYAIDKITEALEMRHLHNHVLRHTFASHAVMRGVPMRQVQEWLGHQSITTTMRYAHLSRGYGDELIKRLAPENPHGEDGAPAGGARKQHKHSTRKTKRPKAPV